MKNLGKIIIGWLLSLVYNKNRNEIYLFVWGHIGEAVYTSSLLPELKRQKKTKINIITYAPFDQIVELYQSNYDSCMVLSKRKFDCIRRYALSGVCIHKNYMGAEWKFFDLKYHVELDEFYVVGFNYKVDQLGLLYSTKHSLITDPISMEDTNVKRIIKEYGIIKSKSVVLIPYAQSAKLAEVDQWMQLAHKLKEKGYKVFTNIKDGSEKEIKETIPMIVPLKYIIPIIQYCGLAISIRCGLTDLLAVSTCNIEVLYQIENVEDLAFAKICSSKLGKDNVLYKKKWYLNYDDSFEKFIEYIDIEYPDLN